MVTRARSVPTWTRRCGVATMLVALPSAVWRLLPGCGLTMGTPVTWRRDEQLPGAGTGYVVLLSVVQLMAALLTAVLFVPGADRLPGWSPVAPGRRLPRRLVVLGASVGAAFVLFLGVASALRWSHVDPFRDAAVRTGWTYLCWGSYAVALAWPFLLMATVIGYARTRSSDLTTSG